MLNFDLWEQLLQQYVDDRGRVHYRAWQAIDRKTLNQWLDSTKTFDLNTCSIDAQLAFWLNLYNALVIAEILRIYPITSIQPKILGIPNWLAFLQFFERSIHIRSEQNYSLNRIEHGTIRPQFQEPRIHFALVCAAIGCPLLRNYAYQPETVREQLEADADRFINNPDKVRYDAATQTLYCSKIFQWYQKDFLTVAESIPAYIARYFQSTIEFDRGIKLAYLPYDWSLNQQSR
jgi:hypothetical protein